MLTDTAPDNRQAAPDVFVSHSSRDKQLFVRPLVECLVEHGARVWYDEYSLTVGDSLSAAIDRGLSAARSGLVIVSPAFIKTALESGWTHYELRGIVSNSVGVGGRRILPIWLDVTFDQVRDWSPPLADLLAIDASQKPIEQVALEIMNVIAPDRVGGLTRLRALADLKGTGKTKQARISDLNMSPVVDRRVPGNVPLRALLVTQLLAEGTNAVGGELSRFLENLSRDLHHERELRLWEAIAGSYSVARRTFELDEKQTRALYRFLLSVSLGAVDEDSMKALPRAVAGPVLEHFQALLELVSAEAVIGEGGLKGVVIQEGGEASQHNSSGDPS